MAIFKRPLYLKEISDQEIDDEKARLNLIGTLDNSIIKEVASYLACRRYNTKVEVNKEPPSEFPEHLKEQFSDYVDTLHQFLDSVDTSELSGGSLLQQSNDLSNLWSLHNNPDQKDNNPNEGGNGDGSGDFDDSPGDSQEVKDAKQFMKSMDKMMKQNKSMKSSPASVAEKMSEKAREFSALTGIGGFYSHEFQQGNTISSMAKLTKEQKSLIDKIGIVSKFGKLKSNKISAHFKFPKMKEYGQISQVLNPSDMLMPDFALKLVNRDLIVKEFIPEEKQILFVMIDDSGSMSQTDKMEWVKAILWDRFHAVWSGKAELYITTFIQELSIRSTIKVATREDVLKYKNWSPKYDGGSTNVDSALRTFMEALQKGQLGKHVLTGARPQLVIINDGEDNLLLKPENTKFNFEINAFILGTDNEEMRALVEGNNGLYKRFL
jgi:uncharacterized protein with von Willebrand factor type A (vWA) domain